jgi:hypothetical protein
MAVKHFIRTLAAALAAFLFIAGCAQEPAGPVANLSVGIDSVTLPFGSTATLDVMFRPLVDREVLGSEPIIFVHLLNGAGDLKRTFDQPLDTAEWQVGVELVQAINLHQSYLAEPLDAMTYRITVGLYEVGGENYALESGNALVGDHEYQLADLVVPRGEALAEIDYLGDWQDFETPDEKQIVRRRWLGDGGGLGIEPVSEPVRLTLSLMLLEKIPGSDLAGSGRSFVKLVGNCSEDAALDGAGRHEVVLVLSPPEEGERCEIEMQAESVWTDRAEGIRRSVYLELLMIDPAGSADGA